MLGQTTAETELERLGATPDLLTEQQRRSIDVEGYVVLDDVLSPAQLVAIRERLVQVALGRRQNAQTTEGLRRAAGMLLDYYEKNTTSGIYLQNADLLEKTRTAADELRAALTENDLTAMRQAVETRGRGYPAGEYILDLVGTDPVFDLPLNTPRVLAAVRHILGPEMHSWGIFSRSPRIGEGHQGLHRDFGVRNEMCNALWLIDDMTAENGATRLVPRSQFSDDDPDPSVPRPDEIILEGKAGQVVVFSERVLHGGTTRTGGGPRRVLISPYSIREKFRDHPLHVTPTFTSRLSPAQVWLLNLRDPKLSANERAYAATGTPAPGYA